jgi:predicted metal-dependent peptidase
MTITNQKAADQLIRARTALILDQPFFGSLALRLPLVENLSIKTLAVDGKNIFYNPEFVLSMSHKVTMSAVAHEVMHCVLDHLARRDGRDPKKWNHAGDYALNQILEDVQFEIPKEWLRADGYKGMSADEIYKMLPDMPDDQGGAGAPGGSLDEMLPGEPDPAAQTQMTQEWKVATIQAANAAKAMGKLPSDLQRFVEGLTASKVDWRAELRRFVSERSKADYSWSRPNRTMLHYGVYMPSLYSESMGDIIIGVDTSGSISDDVLAAFSAEVNAIAAEVLPATIHVVYCDAQVNHVDVFQRHDQVKLTPHGGGGTRFSPVFDYVAEQNLRPVCLVYLTDLFGETNFPEPEYPTLWTCISNEVAPWGTTVKLEL